MTDIFEIMPSAEDIFRLTVPYGEPCGCYENRGCLESIYCSCECDKCTIQRKVDAGMLCTACRKDMPHYPIQLENAEGDTEYHFVCSDCMKIHRAEDYSVDLEDDDTDVDEQDNDIHACTHDCECSNDDQDISFLPDTYYSPSIQESRLETIPEWFYN